MEETPLVGRDSDHHNTATNTSNTNGVVSLPSRDTHIVIHAPDHTTTSTNATAVTITMHDAHHHHHSNNNEDDMDNKGNDNGRAAMIQSLASSGVRLYRNYQVWPGMYHSLIILIIMRHAPLSQLIEWMMD
jgi:hypothetical protein